jgi:hypothetical protein
MTTKVPLDLVKEALPEDLGNVSGAVELDLDVARFFKMVLTGNTTITFANVPSGEVVTVTIRATQDGTGSHTFGLPASVQYSEGIEIPIPPDPDQNLVFMLRTEDGGTDWEFYLGGFAFGVPA